MQQEQYELESKFAGSHWWWVSRRKIIRRVLSRYFSADDKERRILEVGSGSGSNFELLREFGLVSGIEMSCYAANVAKSRFPEIDVKNISIPGRLDQTFEMIAMFDVLEHIEDDIGALEWVAEHLEDFGHLILTVPAFSFLWSEHDEVSHHKRRYSKSNLMSILGQRFDIEYCSYFNTHLFPAVAAVRVGRRLRGKKGSEEDVTMGANGIINTVLTGIFSSETLWIPRLQLPFGVSLIVAARKKVS